MTIELAGHRTCVRITANGLEIDAHWNSFNDVDEAKAYYNRHLTLLPGVKYGFTRTEKISWDIVA